MSWTSDGTQIAAGGSNGSVSFGQLLEQQFEWNNLVLTVVDSLKVKVYNIVQDSTETLDFRDKIIKISLSFGYLIVATLSQCWIYDVHNWNTPHVFDVKDSVNLIMQCKKFCKIVYFLL